MKYEDCPCFEDYDLLGYGAACGILDDLISGQRCTRRAGHDGDHIQCGLSHSANVWEQMPGDLEKRREGLRAIGNHALANRWPE